MPDPRKTAKASLISAVVWTLAAVVCIVDCFKAMSTPDLRFFTWSVLLVISVISTVRWWIAYVKIKNHTDHKINQEEENND